MRDLADQAQTKDEPSAARREGGFVAGQFSGAQPLKLFGLRSKFNAEMEAEFQSQRSGSTLLVTRIALIMTGLFMLAFVLADRYLMDAKYPEGVREILMYFCVPITLLGGVAISFRPTSAAASQIIVGVLLANSLAWLWCYPQLVHHLDAPPYAFEAMLVFTAMTYSLSGQMFWGAASLALFNSLAFMVVMSFSTMGLGALIYCGAFLLALNLVGFIDAYLREKSQRSNFLNIRLVHELAERDPLTGLYNRRAFAQRMNNLIRQARRERASLTVLAMDVDNFKDVNDGLGHPFGDKVLIAAAAALSEASRRPLDCVARMGGDEFVAVWHQVGEIQVQQACESLMALFAKHFEPLKTLHGIQLTMSVGAAHAIPAIWHDGETLLKFADNALYQTKANGRNHFTVVSLRNEDTRGNLQIPS